MQISMLRRVASAVALAVLGGAAALTATPAAAQVGGGGSPSDYFDQVATVGTDGALWTRATGDDGWTRLGGTLTSAPVVLIDGDDFDFLALGADGNVWVRSFADDWRPFAPRGTSCTGGLGASTGVDAALVVACRGGDGALWVGRAQQTAGALPQSGRFTSNGGGLKHSPAASFLYGGGDTFLFAAVGTDDALWTEEDGGAWQRLGGTCTSAPAVTFDGTVGCQGTDRALWVEDGSGWRSLGGTFAGTPALVTHNALSAYVLAPDGGVWFRDGDNGAGWAPFGGRGTYGVSAVTFGAGG